MLTVGIILVLVTVAYLLLIVNDPGIVITKKTIITVLIVIIGLVFIVMNWKQHKEAKMGHVIEDEMTRKADLLTGYYSFRFSIYFWLLLMFINLITEGHTDDLLFAGVLVPSLSSIFVKWYFTKTGNSHEKQN